MNTIHEKMKSIRKKVNKAEAIERNLEKARLAYEDGYYHDCVDAATRVTQLDSCHGEANYLRSEAVEQIDRGNSRRKGVAPLRNAIQAAIVKETEVMSPTTYFIRGHSSTDGVMRNYGTYCKWSLYAICLIIITILMCYALVKIIIPLVVNAWPFLLLGILIALHFCDR